jgi:hypothetical protein
VIPPSDTDEDRFKPPGQVVKGALASDAQFTITIEHIQQGEKKEQQRIKTLVLNSDLQEQHVMRITIPDIIILKHHLQPARGRPDYKRGNETAQHTLRPNNLTCLISGKSLQVPVGIEVSKGTKLTLGNVVVLDSSVTPI